ncbi:MAG: hypothetical protein M9962_12200 [Oligoflexia bacterium]|nr:hypothetical protein [Oligoflexia bacterium]
MEQLAKHPLEKKVNCPICNIEFSTLPLRRGRSPDDQEVIVDQHICPNGHVYLTEVGKDKMLSEW